MPVRMSIFLFIAYTAVFLSCHYNSVKKIDERDKYSRKFSSRIIIKLLSDLSVMGVYLDNSDRVAQAIDGVMKDAKWINKISIIYPDGREFYSKGENGKDKFYVIKKDILPDTNDRYSGSIDGFIFPDQMRHKKIATISIWCQKGSIYVWKEHAYAWLFYFSGLLLIIIPVYWVLDEISSKCKKIINNIDIIKSGGNSARLYSDCKKGELDVINEGIIDLYHVIDKVKYSSRSAARIFSDIASIAEKTIIDKKRFSKTILSSLRNLSPQGGCLNKKIIYDIFCLLDNNALRFDLLMGLDNRCKRTYEVTPAVRIVDILSGMSDAYPVEVCNSIVLDSEERFYVKDNGCIEKIIHLIIDALSKKSNQKINISIKKVKNRENYSYLSIEFFMLSHAFSKEEIMVVNDFFDDIECLELYEYLDSNIFLIAAAALSKGTGSVLFMRSAINGSLVFHLEIPSEGENVRSLGENKDKELQIYSSNIMPISLPRSINKKIVTTDYKGIIKRIKSSSIKAVAVLCFSEEDIKISSSFRSLICQIESDCILIGIVSDDYVKSIPENVYNHWVRMSEVSFDLERYLVSVLDTESVIASIFQ